VFPGWGAYCASKSALEALVKTWHLEFQGSGVRVLSLYPGATDSDIWASAGMADVNREGMVTPDEVAEALAYMVSQDARVRVSELFIEPSGGDV
jgi:NAD(P)-dependent dehydrogenase (short-subunit alcohol dehydrogenase family)